MDSVTEAPRSSDGVTQSPESSPSGTPPRGLAPTGGGTDQIRTAETLFADKKYAEAVSVLEPLRSRLSRKGLMLLGKAHLGLNQGREASQIFSLITNRDPVDYVALTYLGQAQIQLKKEIEANKTFRKAINLKRDYRPAYEALIALARTKGNKYDVRALLEDAVQHMGPDSVFLAALCAAYSSEGFVDKALDTCREAIKADRKIPENHVYLGLTYIDDKNKETARKVLRKASDQFPKSAFAQCAYGEVLRSDEDWLQAAELFQKGVLADPKNAPCWIGLAEAQFENRMFEDSLKSFATACTLARQKVLPMIKRYKGKLRKGPNKEHHAKFEDLSNRC